MSTIMFSFIIAAMASIANPLNGVPAEPPNGFLVVVNQFEHSVSAVDPDDGKVLGTVLVGVNGHEVAVPKEGRFAYVPIYSNVVVGQTGTNGNHIDVVDLHEFKVTRHIDLGKDVRPHCAKFGPDGTLFVSAELDQALYAVDVHTGIVTGRNPSDQPETHMFVVSKDGKRAYTANISSGTVSAVDLIQHKLVEVMPVAKSVQRITLSADGKTVFTHEQGNPRIAMIDTQNNKVTGWIDIPSVAFASLATADRRWLLAISPSRKCLYAIDLRDNQVKRTIDLPGSPMEAVLNSSGSKVYISCIDSGQIAVIDLRTWQSFPSIKLTAGVDGLAWASR